MAKVLVSDVATTTLATGISSGATSCTVAAGTGSLFPTPNPSLGTYFYGTFVAASNPNTKAIVKVTARSTDTMTITPVAAAWSAGDTFALLNAAELLAVMVQTDDLQAQLGNYAIDTGSANAYAVTLTPAISAPIGGMPIRWLAGHSNTGPSTFNGSALVLTNGSALSAGDIVANGIYTSTWNTALDAYQLDWVILTSFNQLAGEIANDQVPQSAVTQFTAEILAGAALTGDPTAPTAAPGTSTTQIATTAFAQAAANAAAAAAASTGDSFASVSGYQTFLSGLLLQWGVFTSNGGAISTSFPQVFPNYCFGVQLTAAVGGYTPGVTLLNDSYFTADTSSIGSGHTVYYFAVGH